MRGPVLWLTVTAGACLVLAGLPAASLATPPAPTIEWTSAWTLTPTDATVGAEINPEGLPDGVYYQFQVVENTSEYLAEIACSEREIHPLGLDGCVGEQVPDALPIGEIANGTKGKSVSLELANAGMTLKPGTTYHYRVLAAKALLSEDTLEWESPAVVGPDQTFTTPPAGSAPAIESVSISHLTPTDATLQARIDTEGLPATYQFDLWSSPCSKHGDGCELILPITLPSGLLLGSFVGQTVSLDLNSAGVALGKGEYGYSVTATSTGGSTHGPWQEFEAPPGVIDPLSPGVSPQSGGGQPAGSNMADQTGDSGTTSSPALQTSGTPGESSEMGAPKRTAKRRRKTKHRHHRTKAARHRAKVKSHKR